MNATTLVNGVLMGGLYALIALGLSIVFGVLRLINLAHGVLVIGAAYAALELFRLGHLGPFAALPIVVVVAAIFGYGLQRLLLTDLLLEGTEAGIVGTFGLAVLGEAAIAAGFTSNGNALSSSLATASITIDGVTIEAVLLVACALAVALAVLLQLGLTRTRAGSVLRAAAKDPATAELMGIDVRRVFALAVALAASLAALAGVFYGVASSFTPTSDTSLLLIAVAVVVVGGVGNITGTLVAGLGVGLVQAISVSLFGGGYSDFTVYLLFFVVLVVRPTGLLGRGVLG
jgi:branched-chain amino acid transport system permease protein